MNERIATKDSVAAHASRRGLARALLAWVAQSFNDGGQDRALALGPGDAGDHDLAHILDTGLAPLLHHAVRDRPGVVPGHWREVLTSAELTARFAHQALRDSAADLIDVCRSAGVEVTLLKGISIADPCYPAPHLRPMGDVDVLLSERDCATVRSALLDLGYAPMEGWRDEGGEPHGAPLCDPRRRVWVEPHTALFHRDARVNDSLLFTPAHLARSSVASTFDGRPVLRLSDELQLTYIACYWLRDVSRNGVHPTYLIPLLDALLLLKASGRALDWDRLIGDLDNELAAASLCVLLNEVRRFAFEDVLAPVIPRIAARQRILGDLDLRVLHRIVDACLLEGRRFMGSVGARHPMIERTVMDTLLVPGPFARKLAALPWNLVFPPRDPERYSLRYHRMRVARLLRGGR
ncbi:MAG: nucleotidyltransferase family protein [Burkholderiales bacterium]